MKQLFFALLLSCIAQVNIRADEFDLYYLGGQSNMDGYGTNSQLPEELQGEVSGVLIFHGNTQADQKPVDGRGKWETLRPGHGVGFQSDGETNTPSNRFGVEITFARGMRKSNPDRRIAIIKYSRGGTSIHEKAAGKFGCWEPDFEQGEGDGKGINQYDHFLATMRNSMKTRDIDGDGTDDTLVPAGIVWMQGESDANDEVIAKEYADNLKRLMDLVRATMRSDDLPVVVGRISDSGNDEDDGKVWDFGELLRSEQATFAKNDPAAALVTSTDEYGYSDKWHYDSAGYIDLGRQFAKAMIDLQAKAPARK